VSKRGGWHAGVTDMVISRSNGKTGPAPSQYRLMRQTPVWARLRGAKRRWLSSRAQRSQGHSYDGGAQQLRGEAVKQRNMAIALLAAVLVMTALMGCAPPTATSPSSTQTREPRAALDSAAPLPTASIVATSFINDLNGWAVGGELEDGVGSLVQRTTDGGLTWKVLYADGAGFPLRDVAFTDALHGWAVSSSGTLVGNLITTADGGHSWVEQFGAGPMRSVDFTDDLHGVVRGLDGDSPSDRSPSQRAMAGEPGRSGTADPNAGIGPIFSTNSANLGRLADAETGVLQTTTNWRSTG